MEELFPPVNEQMDIIRYGISEIIPEEDLVRKLEQSLKNNKPLIIKLGCDPSRPDLHLGHSVVLRKLRHFQDLGHEGVLIVGDFTGMIGDPSGKSKTRPPLTIEETRRNGQSYFEQATKILSNKRIKILYNSEWLGTMNFSDVIKLAGKYTIARMLERDDFEKRYREGEPICLHEFLYPLAQAMDSVAIKSDVELGGTDQKFNLLVGRDIQREYGQEAQVAITLPLLVGTDGVEKMSKSLGNYIGITEPPKDMYGKTLSIPDSLIYDYLLLTTDIVKEQTQNIKAQIYANPRDMKRLLARELVTIYWSKEDALKAEEEFDRIFIKKDNPIDIQEYFIQKEINSIDIIQLLCETKLATSRSEARRLIEQGGVSIDGTKITDYNKIIDLTNSFILKVGKRKFFKIKRR